MNEQPSTEGTSVIRAKLVAIGVQATALGIIAKCTRSHGSAMLLKRNIPEKRAKYIADFFGLSLSELYDRDIPLDGTKVPKGKRVGRNYPNGARTAVVLPATGQQEAPRRDTTESASPHPPELLVLIGEIAGALQTIAKRANGWNSRLLAVGSASAAILGGQASDARPDAARTADARRAFRGRISPKPRHLEKHRKKRA